LNVLYNYFDDPNKIIFRSVFPQNRSFRVYKKHRPLIFLFYLKIKNYMDYKNSTIIFLF